MIRRESAHEGMCTNPPAPLTRHHSHTTNCYGIKFGILSFLKKRQWLTFFCLYCNESKLAASSAGYPASSNAMAASHSDAARTRYSIFLYFALR